MPKNDQKPLRTWLLSLGCPKNRVDTERLAGSLGVPVAPSAHIGKSELVFINTCAFIEGATRESIREIVAIAAAIKKLKKKPLFVVAGCLPGRYGVLELARELPEVDIWLTPDDQDNWASRILGRLRPMTAPRPGRLAPAGSSAWLKIGDGCAHACSFCAIPNIRGKLRSEPADKILAEAQKLVELGARELVLVAQDVTAWGADFPSAGLEVSPVRNLQALLGRLAAVSGLEWLRLLYLYPNSLTDSLLATMADIGSPLLPYLDIPLQHSDPQILAAMGRSFRQDPRQLLERIARFLPGAALRTTIIVGFPGETAAQFRNLCQFVEEARFHHLGVFAYQREEGTAAASLPDQIPEELKQERKNELMALQAKISARIMRNYVGEKMRVLVENDASTQWPGLHTGRVWFQAPEIDGLTYISGPGVKPGVFVEAEIEESHTYDLTALV